MGITGDIIDVYVVNEHDNAYGTKWVLADRKEAEKVARGRGEWGGNAQVAHMSAFQSSSLGNNVMLILPGVFPLNLTPDDVALKKANALAKLTDEEKTLLNLD